MNAALFLTSGTSVRLWKERGWLDGGTGTVTYNAWADHFNTFYLLSYGGREDLAYTDFLKKNIVVLPKKWPLPAWVYSLLIPFAYRRELKGTDLYYSAQMEGAWAAALAKVLYRKKFVLHCGYQWALSDFAPGLKGALTKRLALFLEWITYRAADYIVVTSQFAKDYVTERYAIDPGRIELIRNPVDTSLFRPMPVKKIPNSIVYVGRLEPEKNPRDLLEAVIGLPVAVTIYGSGSMQGQLQRFAEEHKILAHFRGNVPARQLAQELSQYAVFAAPSQYENSPKALLEAMSCGLAVVGYNVRGINEIIDHKVSGYLSTPRPADLRQAITDVLEAKELQERFGVRAREFVMAHCEAQTAIRRSIEIFKTVLAQK